MDPHLYFNINTLCSLTWKHFWELRLEAYLDQIYAWDTNWVFLLLLQVPTFELDTNERIQLHRALSLCYWFTQNFEEAQALMQESLKLSKQSPVQLAEHTIENALTLGIFYR